MKLNYLGYYLFNSDTGERVLFDIRRFLKSFCRVKDVNFKNSFHHSGDNLYLMYQSGDVFVFIITRNNDLIRRVNSADLTESEIMSLLSADEHIGFASYVILGESNLGFGTTLLSPKVDVFASYVNQIFYSVGITNWHFRLHSFANTATKAEAMQLDFVSKATIDLEKNNSVVEHLLNVLAGKVTDTVDIAGLQIIIKPKPKKDIGSVVKDVLENIPDEGVKKMVLRAKDEVGSLLTDIYLVGNGGLSDNVRIRNSAEIPVSIRKKYSTNNKLALKTQEFVEHEDFSQNHPDSIASFSDDDSWTVALQNLSDGD